jgi:hypothetical protein
MAVPSLKFVTTSQLTAISSRLTAKVGRKGEEPGLESRPRLRRRPRRRRPTTGRRQCPQRLRGRFLQTRRSSLPHEIAKKIRHNAERELTPLTATPCPTATQSPGCLSRATASPTSRVLPTPASPSTRTRAGSPSRTADTVRRS